ncbi:MAG: type ISP restriction/modification enzyme [Bryobacteraceae bacterium]
MNPLETYLQEMRTIRSSGAVPETAYYPALEALLSEIGKKLKPKVKCIIHPGNRGAGLPDGGLFTDDQLRVAGDDPLRGTIPARGVIEAKGTGEKAENTAASRQVAQYWERYRQVLVTNYRDFLLVGSDAEGNRAVLETFHLAGSEAEFWRAAAHPRKTADLLGEGFEEFLKRVMLYQAPLAAPKDLAWFLASYAREARMRVGQSELDALESIRTALEEALGLRFDGKGGRHFFQSTLIQTLFYGIFSAWVLWDKTHARTSRTARFDWRLAAQYLKVPILRKLFHEVAEPGQLEALGLPEVLDWACAALNRVDRGAFWRTFEQDKAVQYFYEPFLEAFDPELRKDLGVWYTPTEVVQYMVGRVDQVLREDLGRPDGLADPSVYVLDPCCGTGAFLVEVLRKIEATLRAKGGDALLANDLKRATVDRVFGFEILPAPFVVAHLQIGLLLQGLGAPLSGARNERVGVFLTNALTGWEPVKEPKHLPFVELEEEREAADEVKRERPILVILGNPPYNSFAGIASMDEERDLSDAYRNAPSGVPAPQGQGLNDLYVRFFRMAERRIVEKTGQGIVCFISNYSWLDGLSFTGMRARYLEVFDQITIDCLNGDKYKTGKLTPGGDPDPSVFSTDTNREGIQVGTAITVLAKTGHKRSDGRVQYRDLWGKNKRDQLLRESVGQASATYEAVTPAGALGLPFAVKDVSEGYLTWPLLPSLFQQWSPGVKTSRDLDLVAIDRAKLESKLSVYFDPEASDQDLRAAVPSLMDASARYDPKQTRAALLRKGLGSGAIVDYAYRPFDDRHVYWHPETKLLDEKREDLFNLLSEDALFMTSRQKGERQREGTPFLVTRHLPDFHLTRPGCVCFPALVRPSQLLHGGEGQPLPPVNLSRPAAQYLVLVGAQPGRRNLVWLHALAVGHSHNYLAENDGALWQDWPRIPLPATRELLLASASLGEQLAALLDPECPPPSAAAGLISIGPISAAEGTLDPDAGDLEVTAGWGHAGKGGVTMPAKGRITERAMTSAELAALPPGAAAILGEMTFDVWLNERAYWRNIPARVWEYTLGGYQVIKKWLSYRERPLLGRSLTVEEARYVADMARRIAAILLLGPALDANYQAVKGNAIKWPT